MRTNFSLRRMKIARAKRSRGTYSKSSSPKSLSSEWFSTRSPRKRSGKLSTNHENSTCDWWRRKKPAALSTGCMATRYRRSCGRRSVAKRNLQDVSNRSPFALWWTASESASHSRRWSTGASTHSFFPARSRGVWRPSMGRGWQRGPTSTTTGDCPARGPST